VALNLLEHSLDLLVSGRCGLHMSPSVTEGTLESSARAEFEARR
jgi:hypothetical protein